ncbi:LysR substrate-binding domain-containing protein [Frateuria hangzhouensis]|uniref:LysR substrate-binding domain-containing protein n=1 Tax=Frateuria hangzhouensis TaxID=2995589 RepID=UPI002260FDBA|nr:LysR substrate-binding domain-containing protein [Frateuria sp. STR12]MCX7512410.1 LysR substrate-binding domain-containing protein [Frateuria sp. STR12]
MFDFRQLRYFVAVAEELSFTRAAQRLHISQPPLSQQIQALEQDLGARLFDRDKRNVALTEPGRILLEQARQILAKAEETRGHVSDAAAGFSGVLRLAYTISVTFHRALPQTLLRFRQYAPKVRMQLHEMYSEPQFAALRADQIDVGFVRDEPRHPSDAQALRMDVVDYEPLVLAVPCGHPLAGQDSVQFGELANEVFVSQPRELAATLYDRLVQLGAKAGFHPLIGQQAQQINGLLALVAAGVGLALVPVSMRVVQLGGVSYVSLEDPDAYLLLAVASRKDNPSPVLARFLQTIKDVEHLDL